MITQQGLSIQLLHKWSILFELIQCPFIRVSLWIGNWLHRDQLEQPETIGLKPWQKIKGFFKEDFFFFHKANGVFLWFWLYSNSCLKKPNPSPPKIRNPDFVALSNQSEMASSYYPTNWVDFFHSNLYRYKKEENSQWKKKSKQPFKWTCWLV